jgi:N-methylhydantoinase A
MGERIIGVDIGGTFTDLVLVDEAGGLMVDKRLSTVDDFSEGVVEGVRALLRDGGGSVREIASVVHGTTVATNAILERQGARTALITTEGFRDVLEIGRLRLRQLYNIGWEKPAPLCPRQRRFEVRERMGADGQVIVPLDRGSVEGVVAALARDRIESVAVCLLNSYANGGHVGVRCWPTAMSSSPRASRWRVGRSAAGRTASIGSRTTWTMTASGWANPCESA